MAPIYAITFLRGILWHAVFFFLPLILMDRGIGAGWRGVLLALLPATGVLFTAAAGLLSDRLSPRPVIAAGLVCAGLFFGGLAGFEAPLGLVLAFALGGLGMHLTQAGIEAYVYKLIRVGREARGLAGLVSANVLAMAVGLAAGGAMLQRLPAAGVVATAALCYAALVVAARLGLRRLPSVELDMASYRADLLRPRALLVIGFAFLTRLHWGVEMAAYAPFLHEAYGLGRQASGFYMAGPIVLLGIASLWAGRHLDRGRRAAPLLALGAIVAGVGHVAFTLPGSVWGSLVWRCVHEVGEAVMLVALMREVSLLGPRERMGGLTGTMALVGSVATALGALAASPLGAAFGQALPNRLGGLLMIAACALLPALFRAQRSGASPELVSVSSGRRPELLSSPKASAISKKSASLQG